jgi:hypothetical protein
VSFEPFLAAIRSEELRAVAAHWAAARGSKPMPAWRDIDPLQLGRNIRYVWSWKYDRAADGFTGRLAGEEIDLAFGKSMRGAAMRDFYSPQVYDLVFPRHRRVVTERGFMYGQGMLFAHMGRTVVGERIVMPLAEDGVTSDGIFGATLYRPMPLTADDRPLGPDYQPEQVTFFRLDSVV